MGGPVQHYYTKTFLMVCVIQKHRVTYVSMQKKEKENDVTKLCGSSNACAECSKRETTEIGDFELEKRLS